MWKAIELCLLCPHCTEDDGLTGHYAVGITVYRPIVYRPIDQQD
jgi:hypothetical protein